MFSSNPNANIPSSNYLHCAPLFAGYQNGDVLLDPLTGLILPAANHHSLTNMAFTGSNMTRLMNAEHYDLASNFIRNKKPAVKKDRHSKIFTAKGLRDRRVRLSIEIAREFFDLQDMLGFDKASKTLEWLLNKSKMAIKELADQRKSPRNDGELQEATGTDSRSKQLEGISEERKIMEKLTKESRDKARARARRRTREKLCKKIADTSPHQILTQFRSLSQIKGTCEESSSYIVAHQVQEPCSHTQANQAPTQKKQNPSSNFAYDQQNLEISKDIIGCNTSNNNSNLAQNWNIISAMPMPQCSTFRAITKMNLSNEVQVIWEARNQ